MPDIVASTFNGQVVQSKSTIDEAFEEFLRVDVANGDASKDTIRGYRTQVGQWVEWCHQNGIEPAHATTQHVKAYRQHLVQAGYKSSSIAHKLTIIRRFYAAAVNNGMRRDNPAVGVQPPRAKRAQDDFHYLSEVNYTLLLRAVKGTSEKDLRDKSIIAMMGLQCLRTVEIERANVDDLNQNGDVVSLLVQGKNHDRVIYLRPDVAELVSQYLKVRKAVLIDKDGTPLFAACGNRAGGERISRRGVRKIVDFYLMKAELKHPVQIDYKLILRAVGEGTSEKEFRDKVIIAMLKSQGLRTIDLERANIDDLNQNGDAMSLSIRGKKQNQVIPLSPDVAGLLGQYLAVRTSVVSDGDGIPLFTTCSNYSCPTRLDRRGIREIMDSYLIKAGLKRRDISGHALRHTGATLAYKYTQDLRGVQDMLGHADPKTTARYSHVVDRMKNNPALAIQVELD